MIITDPTESGAVSGITLDQLVARVQRKIGDREQQNLLQTSVTSSATSVTMKYPLEATVRGTELSIDDEIMYVWDVNQSAKQVTVQRGYGGSEAAGHTSGTLVTAGPRSRRAIIDAINDTLASLEGEGIYQMRSATIDYTAATATYPVSAELAGSFYRVEYLDPQNNWIRLRDWSWNSLDNSVVIPWGGPSGTVRILYKAGFYPFTSGEQDLQADIGLHSEAAELLVLGAAIRIVAPEEIIRNDFRNQGDTRRAGEVPAGAVARSYQPLVILYDRKVLDEKSRLARKYPNFKPGW